MKAARWAKQDGTGLEHLVLNEAADAILVESAIVGEDEAHVFGLVYRIECDACW